MLAALKGLGEADHPHDDPLLQTAEELGASRVGVSRNAMVGFSPRINALHEPVLARRARGAHAAESHILSDVSRVRGSA